MIKAVQNKQSVFCKITLRILLLRTVAVEV